MIINLPAPGQKVIAERRNPKYILIYGPPKVGKTTILSQLEGCLNLDLENGTTFLDALKYQVKTREEYEAVCEELSRNPTRYPYVAIDTVDKLEEWAETLATENYKKSTIGKSFTESSVLKLPNGAGYLHLRDAFKELLYKSAAIARTVIYVGHVRDKLLDVRGKEVSAKALDLTGKVSNIMCANMDAIGFLGRSEQGDIAITFKTSDTVNCGSRCPHLRGETFVFKGSSFDWSKIFVD